MKEVVTKKDHIRNIAIITFVYLLTHGFILTLTGTWWDEHTWAFSSYEQMWNTSLQLGKPSSYFVMRFIFGIPEAFARLLIFTCYYLGTLGIYYIYSQVPFVNTRCAVLMTLLYIAIPANDARAMRGVFPYTVGYFFFILAFCALIFLQNRYDYKNFFFRGLVLLLFACSFTLNSNLVFYALPLLYIFYYIIKNGQIKRIYRYLDFAILPFVYFILKVKLYPAHGAYEGYNEVTLHEMVVSVFQTIRVCYGGLINIARFWEKYKCVGILPVIIVSFTTGLALLCKRKYKGKYQLYGISIKERIILLAIGCMAMYLGAYAYVVIGMSNGIPWVGVGGRSSILLCVGVAVTIYAVISWVPYEWIRTTICASAVLCGILHFNSYYLSYQQDYYRQQDLVSELKDNRGVLEETKNILYITATEPKIGATRFYSLNSNGRKAFGDQTHFIMNGINDFGYLVGSSSYTLEEFGAEYQMAEYEIGRSSDIEAIIIYENDLSLKDTFFLKVKEIFAHSKFEEELYSETNLIVYIPGMAEFDETLETLLR